MSPHARYFRFGRGDLQSELRQELTKNDAPHAVVADGGVEFSEANATAVMSCVCRVRDRQFPWYLLICDSERQFAECSDALKKLGLPFIAEHRERGRTLLVRRADKGKLIHVFDDGRPRS
jgi:hypothetical protein